jgi:hypothetical protein
VWKLTQVYTHVYSLDVSEYGRTPTVFLSHPPGRKKPGPPSDQAWLQAGYCTTGLSKFSIHGRAVRLRRNPDIVAWINAARMADCESANYTLSQHIAELDEARQTAFAMGVPGAAVQAIISKGKALGYYTDRLRVETETDIPGLISQLREALGPDVANAFAVKLLGQPHEHDVSG